MESDREHSLGVEELILINGVRLNIRYVNLTVLMSRQYQFAKNK